MPPATIKRLECHRSVENRKGGMRRGLGRKKIGGPDVGGNVHASDIGSGRPV